MKTKDMQSTENTYIQVEENMNESNVGMLYVVATPIGNMEDITIRALRTLGECDLIVCEDTRIAKKLLFRHDISKPLLAVSERPDEGKLQRVLSLLREGKMIALITDAGTPGVSDPGNKLVDRAVAEGFRVSPVPGSSALTALLSVTGVNTQEFSFKGFPPHKKGRETFFRAVAEASIPIIYYDSPYRVVKNLELLTSLAPEKRVIVGRELTKMFEEIVRGSVSEALEYYQTNPGKVKGEFVVMVC